MEDFPKNVAFHPHGMNIFKNNTLYVVNHAFGKGGERIEKFKIKSRLINDNQNINTGDTTIYL